MAADWMPHFVAARRSPASAVEHFKMRAAVQRNGNKIRLQKAALLSTETESPAAVGHQSVWA